MEQGADPAPRVDYDALAETYDERYDANALTELGRSLLELARKVQAQRILEVGCGTGHWLETLSDSLPQGRLFGLDPSHGMLQQAQKRSGGAALIRGRAEALPFVSAAFDLIYVVNALHHFAGPARFLAGARRLLRPGGTLAIVAFDPRTHPDWFIYRYFEGTYQIDLERMPAASDLRTLVEQAGFGAVGQRLVARVRSARHGRQLLDDPFIQKHGTSELALLSEEAYQAGMHRIREAIRRGEAAGQPATFHTRIDFLMTQARVPEPAQAG